MNLEIKQNILQKIKQYHRILLFRHIRGDGDCIGATRGLRQILRCTFPEKEILIIDPENAGSLPFLGQDDEADGRDIYANALAIVIDTATRDRVSNPDFALCREVIKIDHHIPVDPYGDLQWVEHGRSSACEMIVDFYDTFRRELVLDREAALCLYAGMVTDSGRFRYDSVTGDTLRLAAILLDAGVDTQMLFARLYLEDYDYLKFKAHVYSRMTRTENGVAWLHIDRETQARFGLNREQVGAAVDCMESILGCLCWMVFIDNDDGLTTRVRMRSRFVAINALAEQYRGGGHALACGATVNNAQEMDALISAADALVRDYKATHTDWL